MFNTNLDIIGDTATKIKELVATDIFSRYIDVIISGSVIGMIFNTKAVPLKNKDNKEKATIFLETLNYESSRIKYLSSLAYMLEHPIDNTEDEKFLTKTFGDWYISDNDQKINSSEKYRMFKNYFEGGIDILYKKIFKNNTNDKTIQLDNFIKFQNEINEMTSSNYLEKTIDTYISK